MPRRGFALRRLLFAGSKLNLIGYDCYTSLRSLGVGASAYWDTAWVFDLFEK
jgi:hypothetical protein